MPAALPATRRGRACRRPGPGKLAQFVAAEQLAAEQFAAHSNPERCLMSDWWEHSSPWSWRPGEPVLGARKLVTGHRVIDAHDEDTGIVIPLEALKTRHKADSLIVLASPQLLWLVRRFVAGCNADDPSKINSQLLHAACDGADLLAILKKDFGKVK
jgi:hypothetical protein